MEDGYEERILSQRFIHSLLAEYWLHEILLHVLEYLGIVFRGFLPLPLSAYVCNELEFPKISCKKYQKAAGKTYFSITPYKLLNGLRRRNSYVHKFAGWQ